MAVFDSMTKHSFGWDCKVDGEIWMVASVLAVAFGRNGNGLKSGQRVFLGILTSIMGLTNISTPSFFYSFVADFVAVRFLNASMA